MTTIQDNSRIFLNVPFILCPHGCITNTILLFFPSILFNFLQSLLSRITKTFIKHFTLLSPIVERTMATWCPVHKLILRGFPFLPDNILFNSDSLLGIDLINLSYNSLYTLGRTSSPKQSPESLKASHLNYFTSPINTILHTLGIHLYSLLIIFIYSDIHSL